ncbi:MAG: CHASE domain-containing protein, partial [Planctomycetales bacterium]|nr:CHASE domain-containing protein [Planctomycetales bacterium]
MTYRSIDSERYSIWLGQVLALAAAYTLAGRLALLLAIPPGYASAVWPAAGIALAAVLLYGNRLWLGVLLGSFCVNAITAWQHGPSWWSMGTAAAIGVGASFQALAGAGLIRRFVGFPTSLNRESEIAKFLLLGGPVSCVVGATCGAAVLLCGTIPPSRFLFSWFTWWVGDTVGVLIFTPLILTFLALPRSAWTKRRFTVGAPLVVTFAVTVLFFVIARHWDQKRGEQAFRQQAHVVVSAIREKCQVPLESVLCLQNFYHGSENITRDEFHTVVGAMLQRHPGMQALEWVERVPRDSRTDYERHQSAELSSPYHITERDSQSRMTLATVRDEYFPVRYLAPLEGNERALGYDLGSSPDRLAALRLACDTGEAVASGRLVLVQEEQQRSGIIIFAPVYRMGRPAATVEDRRRELVGFTLGVFRVEDIVDAAVSELGINGLRVQLVDVTSEDDPTALGACSLTERGTRWIDGRAEPGKLEGPTHAATFEFAKRIWKVEVACGPEFADATRPFQVWCVLAGGLMLVSTIGGFLLILTGRTAQIEALVDERTAKLKNANVRLQHLTLQAESASRAKSEFL